MVEADKSGHKWGGVQMEYVVGVGREVCVGFNSGRFCRIYCSRMHGFVPPRAAASRCVIYSASKASQWVHYSASKGNQFG